jgi:hypothetical protein
VNPFEYVNRVAQLLVGALIIFCWTGTFWIVGFVLRVLSRGFFHLGYVGVRFAFWLKGKETPPLTPLVKEMMK